ncbi:MAG: type I restriction-modification enzyme R subunit C-terminal domain-containing protein [Janthinobacterium lividum]
MDPHARGELARHAAGLPSEREEAKRFDLLALNLQLCILDAAPGYDRLRSRVMELASALEAQSSIPAIRAHGALLQDLQTEAWCEDVTAAMLETVRKRLRGVMHLIEKSRARIVYTDFLDEEGEVVEVAFGAFENPGTFERFRERARLFLRAHEDHVAIGKLRMNRALTPTDLEELERMLRESGVGSPEQVDRAKADSAGLGLFVRSLVGLDPAAVQAEFSGFLAGRTLRPNQIEFVHMMIEHLTDHGVMDAARLYEPPYTDLNEHGLDGLFEGADAERIVEIVNDIHRRAAA